MNRNDRKREIVRGFHVFSANIIPSSVPKFMARVRNIDVGEVPDDVKDIYVRFGTEYGSFENQVKIFAHRPPALRHLMGMLLELSEEAVLPKRHLEIALVVVSKLNECSYCVTHHVPKLMIEGISQEAVTNILEPDCPGLDEVDMLVRDYAVQVTQNANRISNRMVAQLKKHFSEAQIVELTLRIALCGFFNRFNDALQIETEDDAELKMLSAEKSGRSAA